MAFLAIRSVVHLSPAKACQLTHHTIHLIARTNGPKNVPGFRWNSTSASVGESIYDGDGPGGDLFLAEVGPGLMGKSAWIRRTFDPRSNSLSLLTCGGEALAKHASFDPEYNRARDWIRHHPVGPAVLSPVLINGLVGALVEASVPQAIPVSSSMNQIRPLIVGVEVCAKIEVTFVSNDATDCRTSATVREVHERKNGYQVQLKTEVTTVRDGTAIAEGSHTIWIPDYLRM